MLNLSVDWINVSKAANWNRKQTCWKSQPSQILFNWIQQSNDPRVKEENPRAEISWVHRRGMNAIRRAGHLEKKDKSAAVNLSAEAQLLNGAERICMQEETFWVWEQIFQRQHHGTWLKTREAALRCNNMLFINHHNPITLKFSFPTNCCKLLLLVYLVPTSQYDR